MSTPTLDRQLSASVPEGFTPIKPNPITRLWRWIRNHVIAICAVLALIYLFLPIAIVVMKIIRPVMPTRPWRWSGARR